MKLGDLQGLPKEKDDFTDIERVNDYRFGWNECKSEYDNLSIEVDVERIEKILTKQISGHLAVAYAPNKECVEKMQKKIKETAQAIASNLKSILIVKGEK